MASTFINLISKPRLKSPILIEGLPGIGYIGRNAAGYLIEQLGAKKFAELHSEHFPPIVLLNHAKTGQMVELKNEFYYWKAKKKGQRDLIILIGDAQSIDPAGHYEIVDAILTLAKKFKVKELITLGGFSTGKLIDKDVSVFGAAMDPKRIKAFEKLGVQFKDTNIGQIIGASGLLVSRGSHIGMNGVCLMGETSGLLLSDPKATEQVLDVLSAHLKVKIKMDRIEDRVLATEKVIKKIEDLQKKLMKSPAQKSKPDELGYIG